MFKRILPVLAGLLIIQHAGAQDPATLKKHYLSVYRQAVYYNDLNTAIGALHGYLAVGKSIPYKDTLSMLYFNAKSFVSALQLAEEVYKADPANIGAMARAAECFSELGDPVSSVELYEKVVPKTKSPYYIYKMAIGQYQTKKVKEAEASARAVIADTSSKSMGIMFNGVNGGQQAVPLHAAAANLLGVLKMDAGDFTGAKKEFEQAIEMYPEFEGARQNLEICDKKLNEEGKAKEN
ncbi:MAG: tetratricopeptide repeat protein [Chitinophagaceae bacterium]